MITCGRFVHIHAKLGGLFEECTSVQSADYLLHNRYLLSDKSRSLQILLYPFSLGLNVVKQRHTLEHIQLRLQKSPESLSHKSLHK